MKTKFFLLLAAVVLISWAIWLWDAAPPAGNGAIFPAR